MKKITILFISIFSLLLSFGATYAQTPTPKKASPTNEQKTEALSERISDLKEKIASRVAQLDLVEKRAIIGNTVENKETQLTLTDIYDDTRFIDVDEITEFSSEDKKDFGISDINDGTVISVLGLYNKQSGRILARFIETITLPTFLIGKITALDEKNFSVTLQTLDSQIYTVDIETSTATRKYDGEDFVKSGFSQLEVGQTLFVTGFADDGDQKTITAERVLLFSPGEEASPTPSPSE